MYWDNDKKKLEEEYVHARSTACFDLKTSHKDKNVIRNIIKSLEKEHRKMTEDTVKNILTAVYI